MKVIDKIQIRYFRSIKDEKVHNINEVNVFSGSNDSGKSNILRALNLFFNGETSFQNRLYFENDFSKERLEEVRKESIKGRQFIAVKIFFIAPSGHKNLPNKFYVEKMWDRKGNLLNTADNVIYQFKKGKTKAKTEVTAKTALSRFINSIYYQYIPAVRSPVIFDNLLGILQELIVKKNKNNTKVAGLLSDIEKEFNSFTGKIGSEFQKVSGVQSSVRIPSEFQDIFKAFFIDTNTGNFSIPLNFRGDGIQMRYIPVIMDYIARNSRGIHIWGFDEPENSTEYKLCSQMAEDFKNRFSKNAQIFIATHSFHFTTLKGENVSRYRVFKDAQGINSSVLFVNKDDQVDIFNQGISEKINEELGILDLHKDIANEYKEWQENKNVWLNEFKRIEKQLCDDDKLPIIFVEGKT
ncbi:MAG: ATP-binding protein, partial [Candidatus Moranbacteria bacterium]|nr:ATP-binding protein [Candidatus Moranbacteria bacterium]